MAGPLISVDSSAIRPGTREDLEAAIASLVEFVESNEPRAIAYSVYLDRDRNLMTVVQVHPDSASMELHMRIAGPAFARFTELLQLRQIDIYGAPSRELMELLDRKAQLLGDAAVQVHGLHAGFARFA